MGGAVGDGVAGVKLGKLVGRSVGLGVREGSLLGLTREGVSVRVAVDVGGARLPDGVSEQAVNSSNPLNDDSQASDSLGGRMKQNLAI
ncbi:MAG: hypothetical protein OXF22_02305 [Anaerolineaceae bacterium]|nr:hypothetical protein [Anaerolineaceae bacterium]